MILGCRLCAEFRSCFLGGWLLRLKISCRWMECWFLIEGLNFGQIEVVNFGLGFVGEISNIARQFLLFGRINWWDRICSNLGLLIGLFLGSFQVCSS